MRQSKSRSILVVSSLVCLVYSANPVQATQTLDRVTRPDGKQEAYYAVGDEFLSTGFNLLNQYWSEIASDRTSLLRGHLDNYLPIALQSLNHKPAEAMMASFAKDFFAARNSKTGLIPFSYDRPLYRNLRSGGKQPVALIARAVEFCQWFPNDRALQNQCVNLAEATIQHFDSRLPSGNKGGMWGWVDVASGGDARAPLTITQHFGEVAEGMAYLSRKTGNPEFLNWADQKLDFVWQHRMSATLPILHDQFSPTGALDRPEERSSDTDTLYYVRHLFGLYYLTDEPKYRNWAMAVTNLWFDKAWNPQWGHFIRKLNPDGTPAVTTLYGDGKYNTLYILVHAYRTTKDSRYLERLKLAWNNLQKMGTDGLVPEHINRGEMNSRYGLDKQQTIFLEILLDAYTASGDRTFLQASETLGKRILQRGSEVMRLEGGQAGRAFLRLAMARQKVKRLEVPISKTEPLLTIRRGNQSVLEVVVPADVAVVYLPEATYEVRTGKRTAQTPPSTACSISGLAQYWQNGRTLIHNLFTLVIRQPL
jgi:rhamnogalacturonyl hydrolase YesR